MTKVISFAAGPAAGKTTIAHDVFSIMKRKGLSVGWIEEFATDLSWKGDHAGMQDQLWILGEQNHRLYTQLGKVEYIVTDTCMLLGIYYMKHAFEKFKGAGCADIAFDYDNFYWSLVNTINATFNMYDNSVFFVDRGDRVVDVPRYGENPSTHADVDHSTRLLADREIRDVLDSYRIDYQVVKEASEVIEWLGMDRLNA